MIKSKKSIQLRHEEMIACVEDYTKHYTIIKGYCDVISDNIKGYYNIVNNSYWVILGNISDEAIVDIFNDSDITVKDGIEREGVYEYVTALYYSSCTWEEPTESYIDYIEFKFIETIESRDRDIKLNKILDKDLDLFNI